MDRSCTARLEADSADSQDLDRISEWRERVSRDCENLGNSTRRVEEEKKAFSLGIVRLLGRREEEQQSRAQSRESCEESHWPSAEC